MQGSTKKGPGGPTAATVLASKPPETPRASLTPLESAMETKLYTSATAEKQLLNSSALFRVQHAPGSVAWQRRVFHTRARARARATARLSVDRPRTFTPKPDP